MNHHLENATVILLAAGEGRRVGVSKGLLEVHGEPWLVHQLRLLSDRRIRKAVVVVGAAAARYREDLGCSREAPGVPVLRESIAVTFVENPEPALGPFSSLLCALRSPTLRASDTLIYVLPVDVPAPEASVWSDLAVAIGNGARAAIPELNGRGGHPVALSAEFSRFLALQDPHSATARLDWLLQNLPMDQLARISTSDRRVRTNLNTPGDWAAYFGTSRGDLAFG